MMEVLRRTPIEQLAVESHSRRMALAPPTPLAVQAPPRGNGHGEGEGWFPVES
jgi:hypothetical protein